MKRIFIGLSILVLAALACNMPERTGGGGTVVVPTATTGSGEVTPTSPAGGATEEASAEPDATEATTTDVLPAPVYFIADDGQVWRVEVDGVTATKITQEPAPVTHFAISPADGSVVYASNNLLLNVDSLGGSRSELFNGGPLPADDDYAGQVNRTLGAISISPDGGTIAFAYGGVHLYSIVGGTESIVLASSEYPVDGIAIEETRFYGVGEWSPTGTHLLVPFNFYPEGGGVAALDVAMGTVTRFESPDGIVCCYQSWDQAGTGVYISNDSPGIVASGLWKATLTTPLATTLIQGADQGGWRMPAYARQLSDGKLYYFFATTDTFPDSANIPLTMTRSDADGQTGQEALRSDGYDVSSVLWHPDGLGAVIQDFASVDTSLPQFVGTLLWLPADGSAAVTLPKTGRSPQWGQ